MKLQIEQWILDKHYSTNVRKLFSESVICYRNSAYRASLIFSYIGFLTIIKETIIKAKRPAGFREPEWNSLIAKINNDELWEKEVYEALIRVAKPIFPLNDDLRLQLRYWKDRRNDCAHFKTNEIESHHTEAFWSFIKSNISKMTVEGGMETLLNKFEEHFDDTKTPPDADFTYLVKEIDGSVMHSEMHDFFKQLKLRIDETRSWFLDSSALKVYHKILDAADVRVQESLVEYLKQEQRDIRFLDAFPDKVLQLNYSPTDVRTIWKSRMYDKTTGTNPFNIFAGLLRNKLIPKGEIEEANSELFSNFNQTNYHWLPETKDIDTLKANGFFDVVHKIAIEEKDLKDFMWVNSKCDLIMTYLENNPLKPSAVKCICEMAERTNYSQWLIREINNDFENLPEFRKGFKKVAATAGIRIPTNLR